MGLFSCFAAGAPESEGSAAAAAVGPRANDGRDAEEQRRLQSQLQHALSEIQALKSKIAQESGAQRDVAERDASAKQAHKSSKEQAERELQQQQQLQEATARLKEMTAKASELELQATALKAHAQQLEAQAARSTAAQEQQARELEAAKQELEQVKQQAASSAAAIDDIYVQTATFLQASEGAGATPAAGAVPAAAAAAPVPAPPADRDAPPPLPAAAAPDPAAPSAEALAASQKEAAELQATVQVWKASRMCCPHAPTLVTSARAGGQRLLDMHSIVRLQALRANQEQLELRCEQLTKQVDLLQVERTSVQQAHDTAFDQGQVRRRRRGPLPRP